MTIVPLPHAFFRAPLAHRALHDRSKGCIENSLCAVRAAVAAGYGIEIDLQLSWDGVAMVFHDDQLDRLAEATGPLADRTAAELGAIRLQGSTDTIPTFAQVLAAVAGRVPLLVELKDQTHRKAETDGRLEAAVARDLAAYIGPVALMSYNPFAVENLRHLCPTIPRGITTSSYGPQDAMGLSEARAEELRQIPDYDRTRSSFISHEATDLDRPRVAELKAQGAAVLCWTIRSPQAEALARMVAQNVTFEGYLAAFPS